MLKVLQSGLYTSIQDLGRKGFCNYGVPLSGAMDAISAKLSNAILGNEVNHAVMEITLQGPRLLFIIPTTIAIAGADLSPVVNKSPTPLNKPIAIHAGDILEFGERKSGVRCYLAIAGGFKTELVLGSRSFYPQITPKAIIEKGDSIPYNSSFRVLPNRNKSIKTEVAKNHVVIIDVFKAPEFDRLTQRQQNGLLVKKFTLGINNRMAYQLQEPFHNQLTPILSSAVLPGTVQLTPSGKLIVLMRDCQTTGGYPRVLQLSELVISLLSQKSQNEKISFRLI